MLPLFLRFCANLAKFAMLPHSVESEIAAMDAYKILGVAKNGIRRPN